MKTLLSLLAGMFLLTGCVSPRQGMAPAAEGKAAAEKSAPVDDEEDPYADALVPDPLEPVNRATFWLNHQLYRYALRPVSKGYEFLIPEKGREAVYNAFENVKFPVRFTNDILQLNFPRAGQEIGKFLVNSTAGIGGLGRPAQHISWLADVPPADTAQTFARWGIPNGFYLVLPVLGPTTLRDGVGLAGDYALNPITWCGFIWGGQAWFLAVPSANTMRSLPVQMDIYDAATRASIDRYLAARSTYMQYRNEVNARARSRKSRARVVVLDPGKVSTTSPKPRADGSAAR